MLAANQRPDHTTIARFRQTHEAALAALFTQVLTRCAAAGMVKVGVVALDGTKVKADAALAANRTAQTIEAEVTRMLTEAKATDAAEDWLYGPEQRGDKLPEALRERRSRLARLKARQAEEAATGRKTRGRKPQAALAAADATAKANVTAPESRIMKTQGGYLQGYNAQAVVTKTPIILAAEVTQEENDVWQLQPLLTQAQETLQAIRTALAYAGYCSEANLMEADPVGPDLLIALNKDWKQRQALREQPPPRGRCPKGLTARTRMARPRLTTRGRRLYTKRGQTVEPVFGQIKRTRGGDRFMRRGRHACDGEWKLLCATHNLRKLWRSGKAAWLGPRRYRAQRPCGWENGQKTRR